MSGVSLSPTQTMQYSEQNFKIPPNFPSICLLDLFHQRKQNHPIWNIYPLSRERSHLLAKGKFGKSSTQKCLCWLGIWTRSQEGNGSLLLIEEIRRSPVEVGSLSHYLQGFIHPNGGWPWDFWTINSISNEKAGSSYDILPRRCDSTSGCIAFDRSGATWGYVTLTRRGYLMNEKMVKTHDKKPVVMWILPTTFRKKNWLSKLDLGWMCCLANITRNM